MRQDHAFEHHLGPVAPQPGQPGPNLQNELVGLQAEKAQNPAGFSPDKQARLDALERMLQGNPGAGNPAPDPWSPSIMPRPGFPQQGMRPGFFDRLKYLFTGNPTSLAPGRPAGPYQNPMANQCGGYPGQQYSCGGGGNPMTGGPMGGSPMGGAFGTYMAMETAQTAMMGMWALSSSFSGFMPWGGTCFYTPFSPFMHSFF